MNILEYFENWSLYGGGALVLLLISFKFFKIGIIYRLVKAYFKSQKSLSTTNVAKKFKSKKRIKVQQHDISDCAAACIASVAAFYNFITPVSKIRQIATTDREGTNFVGLLKAFKRVGFDAKAVKGNIGSLSKVPLPAIAHIHIKDVLLHYVTIYKISPKSVTIMDPSDGNLHNLSIQNFKKVWTGKLIICLPGDDFYEGNEKKSVSSRYFKILTPFKGLVFQLLFGGFIYTIIGLSMTIYVQKITDNILISGNKNLLNLMGVVMIFLLIIQAIVNGLKNFYTLKLGQSIDIKLVLNYYNHILNLPQRFFDNMMTGDLISRVNDAMNIRHFLSVVSLNMVINMMILISSFILMFTYYWKLALMILAIIPLYAVIYSLSNIWNKKFEREVMENSAELEGQL